VTGDGREQPAAAPHLDVVLGRCDSLRAEVYVRAVMPPSVAGGKVVIQGTLVGPRCSRSMTLPVTARLAPLPAAATATAPAARVILTEPSYWTPEVPSLYQLDATLAGDGRDLAVSRCLVGLRRLGVRGRSLWLDGHRFVPRAVATAGEPPLEPFREASVGAVVAMPSDTLLDRCDQAGVVVIGVLADIAAEPSASAECVARWARHPAMIIALIPRAVSPATAGLIALESRRRRGTLLVAHEVDGTRPPPVVPDGVDLLVVAVPAEATIHEAWRASSPSVPLVARRAGGVATPSRRECEALQAALAGWATAMGGAAAWDWAGYLAG